MLLAFDTSTSAVTVALHDGATVIEEESAVDARRHGELLAVFIDKVLHRAGATPGDLTGVAVGTGPGPYTGLRAGLVTARVLGSALGIRTDGICSLDVIAAGAAALAADPAGVAGPAGAADPTGVADPAGGAGLTSVAGLTGGAGIADGAELTSVAGPTGRAGLASVMAGSDFLVATDARRREVYWARYTAAGERTDGPQVSRPAELPVGLPVAGEGAVLYPELADRPIGPRFPSAAWLARLAAARQAAGTAPGPAEPLYLRRPDAREPGKPKRVTP